MIDFLTVLWAWIMVAIPLLLVILVDLFMLIGWFIHKSAEALLCWCLVALLVIDWVVDGFYWFMEIYNTFY